MKKRKVLLKLGACLLLLKLNAQQLIISSQKGFINFNTKEKKSEPLKNLKFNTEIIPQSIRYLDQLAFYPHQISTELTEKKGYDFFQGLQSPFDSNIWIYMEREKIGGSYIIHKLNTKNQKNLILVNVKNKDRKKLAYKPIAWSHNPNEIYVEGLYLDSAEEHEGLWVLNVNNGKLRPVYLPFKFMRTPILSPDRQTFYGVGSLDSNMNILHGNTDIVYQYDLSSQKGKTILEDKGETFLINGWQNDLNNKSIPYNEAKASNIDYYLPWDYNKELCVSRHGTPAPTGINNNVGICNIFSPGGQHSYAAVDFATSTNSNDNVRAAASGTVSFAGISGSLTSGYGRLVIITHNDGTRTYYAHNSSIVVTQGQNVTQGQIIAKEGTTGGSTGDHIHFEWRAAGGNASTIGSFKDIGQPRVDNRYRSNNSTTPPNVPTPISPANGATNLGLPINFTYSSPVNANAFRIQVATSNTGWNAEDGFTANDTPNATVVVNASINTTNYYWNETAAGSFEGPKASKTYYYTIRSWDSTTGTSNYSPVRTITTAFGVQPIAPINNATVNSPANLSWTSTISGASYRLQIAKTNSGWTAENGFTTDTNPTANVPVNYSTANLLNYTWPNQYTETQNLPTSGNTYYWTVRLWSSATGPSKYTPVRSFTIQ
ncbi:M23 family metallopeptidase [Flavobacterium sp. J27]|uniref:M23 family metallopeptidase n=1 Tax=Flavobacterium sp. J27 TaxID=2060419 RepID=UPI00197AFCDB|nr:M23 family metallopeptidase [Flavobacterium sp. J27]